MTIAGTVGVEAVAMIRVTLPQAKRPQGQRHGLLFHVHAQCAHHKV